MPLPWKKNRVPRISQIVADLQSPKRGGSLVVETGFPTSLIDLFVKNRSRFKRRNSTKKRPDPPPVPPAPPPSPPPEPSNSIDCLEICAESNTEAASVRQLVRETAHVDDAVVAKPDRVIDRVGGYGSYSDMVVVAAILTVIAVIVLTLSAKKLTVGITMSAFALLFLEYVGKSVVSRLNLKSCNSNTNMAYFRSFWLQKIVFKRRKNCEEGSEQEEAIVSSGMIGKVELCSAYDASSNSSNIMEEIKVVEANGDDSDRNLNIGCEVTNNFDKKLVCSLMEDDDLKGKVVLEQCEICECYDTTKTKKGAKFKSKMVKILVPKKLRALKKDKKNEDLSSSTTGRDKSARFEIEEEEEDKEECKEDDGITCSINDTLLVKEVGVSDSDEEGRIVYSGGSSSSGYIILILIALAGLVGGRILALLFTIIWCFILKMIRTRVRV